MMSSADLLEDGFPHGTPDGYEQGCRGAACPAGTEYGLSCKTARMKSRSDYQYQRLAKTGASVAEIADALGLIGAGAAPKAPVKTTKAKKKKPAPEVHTSDMDAWSTPSILTAVTIPEIVATTFSPGTDSAPAEVPVAPPAPVVAPTPKEIRAWAREKGYDVSSRGIIKTEIVEHYWEAHGLLTLPTARERAGLPPELDAPNRKDVAAGEGPSADGERPDYGTMNLLHDLVDERERVKNLTTDLAAAQTELDATIEERDNARNLAIRLEQELARLEQTRDEERASTAAARRHDADIIDTTREELAWHRTALDDRAAELTSLRTALATVEKAFELVLQKWDDATRSSDAEARATAALAYVDKSLDNVADLNPDLPWLGSEVIEMLEDTRALLVTGATTPGTFAVAASPEHGNG